MTGTGTGVSIRLRRLAFSFRNRAVFNALDLDISGGLTFVVGVNGAGKTTLFRLILGDLKARHGEITLPDAVARHQRFGYLPQAFGFPPRFTVTEFVAHLAWLRGVRSSERRELVREALARTGLDARRDDRMGSLSGGMLRRAGVAQALVHRPKLVLLDEPTVGLDPRQRMDLRKLVGELAAGITMIISTNMLEDVAVVGGNVVVLHEGVVRFTGTAEQMATMAGSGSGSDLDRAFLALTEDQRAAK